MSRRFAAAGVAAVVLAVGALFGSAISQWLTPPESGPGGLIPVRQLRERVRVEVLNGGGRAGMAREATDLLRDNGFDVVFYGNVGAGWAEEDSSVVLDRVGRIDMARSVADALGIANVRTLPDSNLYLDVSVVLGAEWLPEAAPPPGQSGSWWDPRAWLGGNGPEREGPIADPRPGGE